MLLQSSIAEQAVDANASAIAVVLTSKDGLLVYDARLVGSENSNLYDVVVHAGNGKVLSAQQVNSTTGLSNGKSEVMKWPWPICRIFGECPRPFPS